MSRHCPFGRRAGKPPERAAASARGTDRDLRRFRVSVIRVRDLDVVQRLIKIPCVLLPLHAVEGEDRADRGIRNRRHVSIARIKAGPGDNGGQARRLVDIPHRGDHHVFQPLQAVEQRLGVLTWPVEQRGGDRHRRNDHRLAVSVVALDKGHNSRVAACNGDENAGIEDERSWNRAPVLTHLYL